MSDRGHCGCWDTDDKCCRCGRDDEGGCVSPWATAEKNLRDFMGPAADRHDWTLSPDGIGRAQCRKAADANAD